MLETLKYIQDFGRLGLKNHEYRNKKSFHRKTDVS